LNRSILLIFAPDWTIQAIRLQADTEQEEARLCDLVDKILKALNEGEVENDSTVTPA
jgi:hypothetical protein